MNTLPAIDVKFLLDFLVELLNTPSPTGMTEPAVALVERALTGFPGLQLSRTRAGALLIVWPGERDDAPRALTAHVDTLGAMVREIKSNGRLKLSKIGGYSWTAIENEGCTVFTRSGRQVRGSILLTRASSHVYGTEVQKMERDDDALEVRLDARTTLEGETRELGIEVGDYVALDPRVELNGGFVRSRHLDDKAGVACVLAAMRSLQQAGLRPKQTTYVLISNFEEVGHGATAGLPPSVTEMVVVDMAAIGEGQNSDEFHASICLKDSGGPYHHGLSNRLREMAARHRIDYRPDLYPYYSSDGTALWRAGGDLAVALIGPGVDASHSYERTHTDALLDTARWVMAYLLED